MKNAWLKASPLGGIQPRMKRTAVILVSLAAVFFALVLGVSYVGGPPKEGKLLQSFYSNRASFEQIRDMLQADENVLSVGERGVNTRDGTFKPPSGNLSVERYGRYLALLKDAHAIEASRWGRDSSHLRLAIVVWASGFAGDTVHTGVCWTEEQPQRQVSDLDAFSRDPTSSGGEGWVFRHIDSNWYLWTDRRTQR